MNRFKLFTQLMLHGPNSLYPDESLFVKKPQSTHPVNMVDEFKKISFGILSGLGIGGYALLIFTIIHVTLSPWLLLAAAPYFLVGMRLGYAAASPHVESERAALSSTLPRPPKIT
jgi:hypothetical protein